MTTTLLTTLTAPDGTKFRCGSLRRFIVICAGPTIEYRTDDVSKARAFARKYRGPKASTRYVIDRTTGEVVL